MTAASGEQLSPSDQIEQAVNAVGTLNSQIDRLIEQVSDFKISTFVVIGAFAALIVAALIVQKLIDHAFRKHLDTTLKDHQGGIDTKLKDHQGGIDARLKEYQEGIDKRLKDHQSRIDDLRDLSQSLLRSSEAVDTDLRERRAATHRTLWRMTHLLPTWPREESVKYERIRRLSRHMRAWYFSGGGMYLSTEAMAYYRMAQEALACFPCPQPDELLDDGEYDDLRGYLSRLRTNLTNDLLSRYAPFEAAQGASNRRPRHSDATLSAASIDDREHHDQNSLIRETGRLAQLIALRDVVLETTTAGGIKVGGQSGRAFEMVIQALSKAYEERLKADRHAPTAQALLACQEVRDANQKDGVKVPLDTIDVRSLFKAVRKEISGRPLKESPQAASASR